MSPRGSIADRLVEQYDRYAANADITQAEWTLSRGAWEKIRNELGMAVEPTMILGVPARIDPDMPDHLILLDRATTASR